MKVILTKDVDTLGENGDVLDVKLGYFLNFLAPKLLAVRATQGALKDREKRLEKIRKQAERKYQDDLAKAEKVNAISPVNVEAYAGETGKLFGTITTKELSKIILDKTGLTVERKQINTNEAINRVGEFQAYVKFSSKVTAEFAVVVSALKEDT